MNFTQIAALTGILTVSLVTAAHAAIKAWRRTGDDLEALVDATREFRPCPDCQRGAHAPARCTCPADCGSPNCTGTRTGFFDLAAWEHAYNEQNAGRP